MRVAKWFGMGLAGLIGLLVIAALFIFLLSGQILGRRYEAKAETLAQPSQAELADAPRQARVHGCVTCHGEGVSGKLLFDIPNVARIFAPNLTQVAAKASDQQLAAAIRQGIGHDSRPLFVMPSQQYAHLSDTEVAALISWIRRQPRAPGNTEHVSVGPLGRVALAAGKFQAAPVRVEEYSKQAPIGLGTTHSAGQQLVTKNCTECHGPALFGRTMEDGAQAPDLTIAGAYDYEQFKTLLRTGRAPGNKKLDLMKVVAENDFTHFRDDEIAAIYGYLRARADKLSK